MNPMKYIQIIYKAYDIYLNKVAKEYDISATELKIMMYLDGNHENDLARDIVKSLMIAKSSTSTSVSSLVSKNYLVKLQDQHDKKIYHLKLTQEGKNVIQALDEQLEGFTSKLADGLTDTEKNVSVLTLVKIVDNIKEMAKAAE